MGNPVLMLDDLPDPVIRMDPSGRIGAANAAFHDLVAGAPTSAIREIEVVLAAALVRAGPSTQDETVDTLLPDGRTIAWRLSKVAGACGHRAAVGRDVTDDRRRAAADSERIVELEAANRDLDGFASKAAHDMQEPLRRIAAFADFFDGSLAGDGARRLEDADLQRAVAGIRHAARRASAVVSDMLLLARPAAQPAVRCAVHLRELVRETVAEVLAGRSETSVTVTDAMTDVVVPADPGALRRLVQNLVVNAIEHREPGRPVQIGLTLDLQPDGSAAFAVTDNGRGVDPADAEALTQGLPPAFAPRGTGLGLAIVRLVCERHGWRFAVVGEPGRGATIHVHMTEARTAP